MWWCWKDWISTFFTLGRCGSFELNNFSDGHLGGWVGLERTDFGQFLLWEDAVVSRIILRKQSWKDMPLSGDTRGDTPSLLRSLGYTSFIWYSYTLETVLKYEATQWWYWGDYMVIIGVSWERAHWIHWVILGRQSLNVTESLVTLWGERIQS